MTEREKILGRIKEALVVLAPQSHDAHGHDAPVAAPSFTARLSPTDTDQSVRQWLPLVGPSFDDRLALFKNNAIELKADFHFLNSAEECHALLAGLRNSEGWKKIGSHTGKLTDPACASLGMPLCRTDKSYDVNDLESCDAAITECDALIAQTGSVLITGRSAGGRALSVLPPHHLVLARRDQLIGDLPEGFALLKSKYAANYPSFISLITGPSRTGDIERILVLGAHGPKKLTILCW